MQYIVSCSEYLKKSLVQLLFLIHFAQYVKVKSAGAAVPPDPHTVPPYTKLQQQKYTQQQQQQQQ